MHENSNTIHIVAGATAGLSSALLTSPLDMIKLKMQNSNKKEHLSKIIHIVKQGGIKRLYRGVYVTAAGYLPTWAIYFTVYEDAKKRYHTLPYGIVLAAMQAGTVCTLLTNPIWIVRTRIMTQPEVYSPDAPYYYRSIREAFSQIYQKEGIATFYKGMATSLLGVSHVAIQFPLYEYFKIHGKDSFSNGANIMIASGTSKVIASAVTYPHEVIRTRLHTQVRRKGQGNLKYNSITETIKWISVEEGFFGFYRGFGLNLFKTVPVAVVNLVTFELISGALKAF